MTGSAVESGSTGEPLLDETIGQNLARTVERFGDGEALVSCHQGIRWTYREFADRVAALARGLLRDGSPGRRPGRDLEPELRGVDARRSTPPPRSA